MKPVTLLLTLVFGLTSLTLAVWLGRYQGKLDVPTTPKRMYAEKAEVDIPIPEKGPFGKIIVEEEKFDFGSMELGQSSEHTFVIKNGGQGPLRIKSGKTSCGQCTIGSVSTEDDIAPGGTATVTIKWTIKASSPMWQQHGEVHTNDPDKKLVKLFVSGRVMRSLVISPDAEWSLGEMSLTEPTIYMGKLLAPLSDDFEITGFECGDPNVAVTWTPIPKEDLIESEGKSGKLIRIEIQPQSKQGNFRQLIQLKTNVKENLSAMIHLSGQRHGPITITGRGWDAEANVITLGEFPAEKGTTQKFRLFARNMPEELVVSDVGLEHNSVQIKVPEKGQVLGTSRSYDMEISVPPGAPSRRIGKEAEKVRLKLNHPLAGEFEFKIVYLAI